MNTGSSAVAIAGYAARVTELAPRYDRISNEQYYAPVRHLIPGLGTRTLDIGAGTGRDALWFAAKGHKVVAVEPVRAFLDRIRGAHPGIIWVEAALPDLPATAALEQQFDFVNLSAVWQHLGAVERAAAVPVIGRLTARGGLVLMSLRHGRAPEDRPVHPIDPDDTVAAFGNCGVTPVFQATVGSVQPENQAVGATWTWLALRAEKENWE